MSDILYEIYCYGNSQVVGHQNFISEIRKNYDKLLVILKYENKYKI